MAQKLDIKDFIAGDYKEFEFSIEENTIDFTSLEVTWIMCHINDNTTPILVKSSLNTNEIQRFGNKFIVFLNSEDTEDLEGIFIHQPQIKVEGQIHKPAWGEIRIIPANKSI